MVARRTGFLPGGGAGVLDAVVIRISLPALIVAVVPEVPVDAAVVVPFAVAWGQLLLLAALILVASRVLGLERMTRDTLLVVVPLGNTSFLGFPAIEALLGAGALPFAVVYDQLGTFLALATYASLLAARLGASKVQRAPLRTVLTFPPFVAVVVAIALRWTGTPQAVADLAGILGATVTPLAMLAIGLRIDLSSIRHRPGALVLGLTLRMVVAPLVVLGVAGATAGQGLVWDVTVLQSAMPPMVTAAVLAAQAGLDDRLAASLAGLGVLLAMMTLPLWTLLLG